MSKKKKKFNIPDPSEQLAELKIDDYSFGKLTHKLNELKRDKPFFSFKFVSLREKDFCFDSKKIDGKKDYISLMKGLKKISDLTYDKLSKNHAFHFHEIDFADVTIQKSDFIKCINAYQQKENLEQIPTLYQFKVFRESRVMGFIFSKIFHLVYFDVNHDAYKRK